uniref:NR LBD domain-containing protein n=1 Tax=Caenorhabditis tropicalis TaxID=1561998 RepID=A0A1I7UZN8_9PELO
MVLKAQCCNACKMFFRRVITFRTPITPCERSEECFEPPIRNFECRSCRFQKCIIAGMIHNQERFDVPGTLNQLSQLEYHRRQLFENFQPIRSFSFDESTSGDTVGFIMKTTVFDSYDWEVMSQLTTMNFLRQLDFTRMLTSQDLRAFLKGAYLNSAILSTAMHWFLLNSQSIFHPGGLDVCPKEMDIINAFNPNFEVGIKCRLIGKLAELKVTREEFLLLSIIFACYPGSPGISKTGNLLLHSYQKVYSNLLFTHCQMTTQQAAPSRFTELLSICETIAKTKQDISNVALLLKVYQPGIQWKEMLRGAIEYLLDSNI